MFEKPRRRARKPTSTRQVRRDPRRPIPASETPRADLAEPEPWNPRQDLHRNPENSAAVPGNLLHGTIGPRKTIDATPESGTDTRQPQHMTPRPSPRNVECSFPEPKPPRSPWNDKNFTPDAKSDTTRGTDKVFTTTRTTSTRANPMRPDTEPSPSSRNAKLFILGLGDPADLVALSGGHTIGRTQCRFFADRSARMEDTFSRKLAANCSKYPDRLQNLDVVSPDLFDNGFFKALTFNQGVFTSDMALVKDRTTAPTVRLFARDNDAFFAQFSTSMERLARAPRPAGNRGEIRRFSCFRTNAQRVISENAFASRGLGDPADLVALSGGHTIGRTQCRFFADRSARMEDTFSRKLAANCSKYPDRLQNLDVVSPDLFDNGFFKALTFNQGVFTSDMALVKDRTTAPTVRLFARDNDAFFAQFSTSMERLARAPRPAGNRGEIRRFSCFRTNAQRVISENGAGHGDQGFAASA
uniref:Uncharacterized protein n=1 Tax=Avena sativa TaxID=4498 RepID=A0ACD6AQ31_AVESA